MPFTHVRTVLGTGTSGSGDREVNNPFGVAIGPDGGLYFCDLDNQCVRCLDLGTGAVTRIAGSGQRGYAGDGGPALDAALDMPHEVAFSPAGDLYIVERDSHVVRCVDASSRRIRTVAGTGVAGFSGDGGPAVQAQLRQPHSIAFDTAGNLLICDIGNHRIRCVDAASGTMRTFAGTGQRLPTPAGARLPDVPLNGPRTFAAGPGGVLYLALREGNAILRIDADGSVHHVAGTGAQGYSGDGGSAVAATLRGPKGLAFGPPHWLYVVDTENHVIRAIDLASGTISTVLGTGTAGDGPEPTPSQCALARPHGICVDASGALYVADSEAHRIRLLA